MEELRRDPSDPNYVAPSKGMDANGAKYFQAVALAQQMGKTVEEVLAFMGASAPASIPTAAQVGNPLAQHVPAPKVEDGTAFLPADADKVIAEEKPLDMPADAKAQAPKAKAIRPVSTAKDVPDDGFVVTEVVDPENATEAELDQVFPDEDEENNWDGKIREGSKVRITYSAPGSRIKWAGKIGKVIRVIGNEKAKVYEVEFKGQKIAKVRLNKKTGKLERGYQNKKLVTTFDQEDIELYS